MMKIEAGKYYNTRDGRKVGPIAKGGGRIGYAFKSPDGQLGDRFDCAWYPDGRYYAESESKNDLIAEWTDATAEPKLWRDVTPEEKGALLLAHHDGKVIEYRYGCSDVWRKCAANEPVWEKGAAYRIRPEPVVETVTQFWERDRNNSHCIKRQGDTHRITFQTIDGKPDCASIRMEPLE